MKNTICKPVTLEPLLKWPGGKEKELKYIRPRLPEHFENYYEPFVGGGAVYTAIQFKKAYINDKSQELIELYKIIQSSERKEFFNALNEMADNWEILGNVTERHKQFFIELYKKYSGNKINESILTDDLFDFILKHAKEFNGMFSHTYNFNIENFIEELKKNLNRKIKRMKELEIQKDKLPDKDIIDNIEAAMKSAFYMHFRHLYNNKYNLHKALSSAIFLFIRNFAYSSMFRYNLKGEFNVPYGGIAYNKKNFRKKIDFLSSHALHQYLSNTIIENEDFEVFLEKTRPTEKDFIFLDPPYDSEFSNYAKNGFTRDDQKRLSDHLINKTEAKWMLIIKNTEFIWDLYNNKGLKIEPFDKTYLVSFMNRNNKKTEHLLIRNY
jgi:DNA adenine methylase